MRIGYLPLIAKGGGVIGKVFDWQSTTKIIDETLKLFKNIGAEVSYINNPINDIEDWNNSGDLFIKDKVEALFVHTLNISGGEHLYEIAKSLKVPVIIAAVPEPESLHEPPYTSRYASFCGAQWNTNMLFLADIKSRFIFGLPTENKFREELKTIISTINAVNVLKNWKVCVVGDKTPGYYGAIFSEDKLMRRFGARVTFLDFGMLKLATEKISTNRINDFIQKYFKKEELDKNLTKKNLDNTVKAYLALDDYAKENGINSYTIKCVPEPIYLLGANPCGINSILTENDYISGCEGDVMTTLTMEILSIFSGKRPLTVDIMSIRETDDSVLLWHCGAGAPSIAGKNKITYCNSPILVKDGIKQGVCADFIPEYDEVSMGALVEDWKLNNYKFFIANGKAVETKPFIGGNPIKIKFNIKGEDLGTYLTDNHLSQHYQVVGKNISKLIEEFCFWKEIELLKL